MRALLAWIEDRTGLLSTLEHFLNEEIPASSGWKQVFGSVALFLFGIQAFTGILLGLNYGPTPGEAHESILYIMRELTGGYLIRGLHHWGASAMVIVVVLHMLQVFLWGAYKKPREVTWMAGVVLLLFTLAFALTGYLLPWDNRAYWGTVVTTQIAAGVPVMGTYVLRLMGAEDGVGVVTFARFYAAHVLILPALTFLLIVFHVYLVRRHGVAPEPGDELLPKEKFYPKQVFKDTAAIFVTFVTLFMLAVVAKAPLGRLADPTDTSYIPRPEWYFQFLFQLLKYCEGPLELFATVVLPGAAVAGLFAVPFLDRGPMLKLTKRTTSFAVVILSAISWSGLTALAIMETPKEAAEVEALGTMQWANLNPLDVAGVSRIHQLNCTTCHAIGLIKQDKPGPNLGAGSVSHDSAWMIEHFKSHSQATLKDGQYKQLATFLTKLKPEVASKLTEIPAFAQQGSLLYQEHQCALCHLLNASGANNGPPLNGLAKRRKADWVKAHFLNPQKFDEESTMPSYKFSEAENEAITRYLLSLP